MARYVCILRTCGLGMEAAVSTAVPQADYGTEAVANMQAEVRVRDIQGQHPNIPASPHAVRQTGQTHLCFHVRCLQGFTMR